MELGSGQRFCEEVSYVVGRADKGDLDLEGLDHVAHKEVTPSDMLHLVVVLGVVGNIARTLAVGSKGRRARLGRADACDELAQVHDVLGGLRERDDLGLTCGERDTILFCLRSFVTETHMEGT